MPRTKSEQALIDFEAQFIDDLNPLRPHLAKANREIGDLRRDVYQAFKNLLRNTDMNLLLRGRMGNVFKQLREATNLAKLAQQVGAMHGKALSGDMLLKTLPDIEIPVADINAAPAGSMRLRFALRLLSADDRVHKWAEFDPELTPATDAIAGDIGAPVMGPNTSFVNGLMLCCVTPDTDAGATKTYQVGETITVVVRVQSGSDVLFGFTVPSVTWTATIVA
jgi:hypothetical protein